MALAHIGQNQIMSLEEDIADARFCATFYPQVRDEVLASHPWTFALKRAVLAVLSEEPLTEWSYQFQLPVDCIRVMQANDFGWWQARSHWVVEGRTILTNVLETAIKYISRIEDASQFTPLFAEAVSVKLAARLAKPLAGNDNQYQALMTEYARLTGPTARKVDAFEKSPPVIPAFANSQLVRARGVGYWPGRYTLDF